MSSLDDVNPKYIENVIREYNAFNQISKSDIIDFFDKKEIDLYKNGMKEALYKTRKMTKHEMDELGIIDQVSKINISSQDIDIPDPTNLLYALIYIRRLSYLFIHENELDNIAEGNEFIPIMIEGLYIKKLTNAQNKGQLLINYENYKKALLKLCENDRHQQINFVDAYNMQDALVTYYLENKKDFYHYVKLNKKEIQKHMKKYGKNNIDYSANNLNDVFGMSDILTSAQKVYKKERPNY